MLDLRYGSKTVPIRRFIHGLVRQCILLAQRNGVHNHCMKEKCEEALVLRSVTDERDSMNESLRSSTKALGDIRLSHRHLKSLSFLSFFFVAKGSRAHVLRSCLSVESRWI
ncbi:hypothetical protein TNCV_2409781 [Trichonephila clavipes]|nr:hypothetical protein TNCV_2409781 [Trichonephila clavipes]